ncbi:DegT/DnrJ/EryC1/StrS aminotransferase family protein [Amylibacter sp.]|nr:DegT/DnrJ/EryC1/StrS aminotransferase family protein [Amylibacter sp.]
MQVPVNQPLIDGNEKAYLLECIETGWISSEGPFVKRFEENFSNFVGRKHGVAVSNGTAALDIAIEALGIQAGDEIILPTFTIISCVQQILRKGAIPVFIDSDYKSWNMNVNEIERKITTRTKAILAVHIYGLTPDMDIIVEICERNNLLLIEDFAEAIGQTYKEKKCGSFGQISITSFYPNKHITTGEGGMVLVDDLTLANKCKSLRNLCFGEANRFVHQDLGWNYRMTNMQAAIGVAQLEQIEKFIEKKRWIGEKYNELLDLKDVFSQPLKSTSFNHNIYWVYGLVSNISSLNAQRMIEVLRQKGIGSRPFFFPLHKQPVVQKMYQSKDTDTYPVAEKISDFGFYIPSGLTLTYDQIEYVSGTINQYIKNVQL